MLKRCVNKVSVPYHSVNVEDRIMETRQISARQNFDLDNRVSGRAQIEKKSTEKKIKHCRSQVGDISPDFRDEKRL